MISGGLREAIISLQGSKAGTLGRNLTYHAGGEEGQPYQVTLKKTYQGNGIEVKERLGALVEGATLTVNPARTKRGESKVKVTWDLTGPVGEGLAERIIRAAEELHSI